MAKTPEQKAHHAAYMRDYRARRGEIHRKWEREWMRRYRNGPRREELLAKRREQAKRRREKRAAELAALKARIADLESRNGGQRDE